MSNPELTSRQELGLGTVTGMTPTAPIAVYWSPTTAAQKLDVDLTLITQLVRSGELPIYTIGSSGCYRICAADLLQLLRPVDGHDYCAALADACADSAAHEDGNS